MASYLNASRGNITKPKGGAPPFNPDGGAQEAPEIGSSAPQVKPAQKKRLAGYTMGPGVMMPDSATVAANLRGAAQRRKQQGLDFKANAAAKEEEKRKKWLAEYEASRPKPKPGGVGLPRPVVKPPSGSVLDQPVPGEGGEYGGINPGGGGAQQGPQPGQKPLPPQRPGEPQKPSGGGPMRPPFPGDYGNTGPFPPGGPGRPGGPPSGPIMAPPSRPPGSPEVQYDPNPNYPQGPVGPIDGGIAKPPESGGGPGGYGGYNPPLPPWMSQGGPKPPQAQPPVGGVQMPGGAVGSRLPAPPAGGPVAQPPQGPAQPADESNGEEAGMPLWMRRRLRRQRQGGGGGGGGIMQSAPQGSPQPAPEQGGGVVPTWAQPGNKGSKYYGAF